MAGYWHLEVGTITLNAVDDGGRMVEKVVFEWTLKGSKMETEKQLRHWVSGEYEKYPENTRKTWRLFFLGGIKLATYGWCLVPD